MLKSLATQTVVDNIPLGDSMLIIMGLSYIVVQSYLRNKYCLTPNCRVFVVTHKHLRYPVLEAAPKYFPKNH